MCFTTKSWILLTFVTPRPAGGVVRNSQGYRRHVANYAAASRHEYDDMWLISVNPARGEVRAHSNMIAAGLRPITPERPAVARRLPRCAGWYRPRSSSPAGERRFLFRDVEMSRSLIRQQNPLLLGAGQQTSHIPDQDFVARRHRHDLLVDTGRFFTVSPWTTATGSRYALTPIVYMEMPSTRVSPLRIQQPGQGDFGGRQGRGTLPSRPNGSGIR